METENKLEVVVEQPEDQKEEDLGKFDQMLKQDEPKLYYYTMDIRAKVRDFVKGIDD